MSILFEVMNDIRAIQAYCPAEHWSKKFAYIVDVERYGELAKEITVAAFGERYENASFDHRNLMILGVPIVVRTSKVEYTVSFG